MYTCGAKVRTAAIGGAALIPEQEDEDGLWHAKCEEGGATDI
jgi:hypothetical protein